MGVGNGWGGGSGAGAFFVALVEAYMAKLCQEVFTPPPVSQVTTLLSSGSSATVFWTTFRE